jgi:hypothetical protein
LILLQINDEEVSLEDLNKVSKCSLHLRMSGCGLEGKLFDRACELVDFVFKGEEAAIFSFSRKENEKEALSLCGCAFLAFTCS